MIQCSKCDLIFKYRNAKDNLKEHYDNFHSKPKWNKDGTIQINAVHQVTLILKRGKKWATMIKDRTKRNDESGLIAIRQLQEFEEENKIKFHYKNEFSFKCLDPCKICGKNVKRHNVNQLFKCYLKLPEHQPRNNL